MEALENLFSSDNEIVEDLKKQAYILDYNKIFFEHLGPELKKLFINRKDKVILKNFLEACQYEYGFFDTKIDLQKAFNIYKKYADLNDYFCMYKMHVIYLCEYEKFNVPLNRVLEKIYLLKCFAYFPNYMDDWNIQLFDKIDISYEIACSLDKEDIKLDKHQRFFDLLIEQKEKYNLTINDIQLIRGALFCYFNDGSEFSEISYCFMNSLMPENDKDYAYYNAKNKCIFYRTKLHLENVFLEEEIDKFYKEIKDKKIYELYADYGNYLIDKTDKSNQEITELFTDAANHGYLFNCYRAYQCLVDSYSFEEIMEDYNKASMILDYLLDEVVFEKLSFSQFILVTGFLIKYSKFPEKINSKYLIYVKEINNYMNSKIIEIEKGKEGIKDKEYYYIIKAYIYFFRFKDVEEQNLFKAIELLDKGRNNTSRTYVEKTIEFVKYNILKIMNDNKAISDEEFYKTKKDLIQFYYNTINLKYQIVDCFVIGEDFFQGITRQKDELSALFIYDSIKNIFCKSIIDCFVKNNINKILKSNEDKMEKKMKDEICGICYTNKVSKIFIPCKHSFCDFCADKLEKELKKCPVCRSKYFCIV